MRAELRNLWEYVRSLYRNVAVVAGSFFLSAAVWSMDNWNPEWWKKPPSWISPLFLGCGIMITQYLAWRDAWIKRGTPERPFTAKGLNLEYQAISHVNDRDTPERTKFVLAANEDLRGKSIRIYCDGPVYDKRFSILHVVRTLKYKVTVSHNRLEGEGEVPYSKGEIIELSDKRAESFGRQRLELIPGSDGHGIEVQTVNSRSHIREDDTNSIVFDFSSAALAARPFTKIAGEIYSVVPLRVTRAEWASLTN